MAFAHPEPAEAHGQPGGREQGGAAAKLRAARAEIFHQREQRVQQWISEKDKALASARLAAQERVAQARSGIEAEAASARQQIENAAGQLAAQVLEAVLPARMEEVG